MIAKVIIPQRGKDISEIWKKKMVPKSPIEQPNKHHNVFMLAFFQVDLQVQDMGCSIDVLIC
tara:strand:+ start:2403 stop:2588 length:186 start_codon:yes stop_codon:yes gene_type:complete